MIAKLINIEWMKVKKYRTFWVLLGMFTLFLLLWNVFIYNVKLSVGKTGIGLLDQQYGFPNVWTNITYYASYFIFFISILNIILVSNEYSFKTNRQNVIDGLTRSDFYHAKWLSVVTLSITTTVITFVIALLFGLVTDGCISCAFEGLTPLLYLLVACINYYGMALLLALLFKRSGLAIGMFLLYVAVIEPMLSLYFTQYLGNEYLNLFLPLQSSDELFHFPLANNQLVKQMAGIEYNVADYMYVLASFGWIVIYYITGRAKILRSDW